MRKRIGSLLAVFIAAFLFIPHTALASATPKYNIGILTFRSNTGNYGVMAADYLTSDIARVKSCNIVERAELSRVFNEKYLSDVGIVEKISAGSGAALGLHYVLMGSINVSLSRTYNNKTGKYDYKNIAAINAKLIDAYKEKGKIVWTGQRTVTNYNEDINRSVEEAAYDLARELYSHFPIKGYIIKVDKGKYYTDLGSALGVKVGDKLTVEGVSDKMIHPITGKEIAMKTTAGRLRVTEVYEDFCVAVPEDNAAMKIYSGDRVIRELRGKSRGFLGMGWSGKHDF